MTQKNVRNATALDMNHDQPCTDSGKNTQNQSCGKSVTTTYPSCTDVMD